MFAFDACGPLSIRPHAGAAWTPKGHPDRLPANYHKRHGVRQFHGCYSVGDDTMWGVVHRGKSVANTMDEESAMITPHEAPKPGTREHFLQVSELQR